MADRGNLKNLHCALKWDWQGKGYLLDPGYMIFEPLLLPTDGHPTTAWISPNQILIENKAEWRMWSGPKSDLKFRFDFQKIPVSESEFLTHWEASFDLPMMHYPIINRIENGVQYYLQKRNLLIRTAEGSTLRKLAAESFADVLAETFHIPTALTQESLNIILKRNPDFFKR